MHIKYAYFSTFYLMRVTNIHLKKIVYKDIINYI